MRCGLGFAAAAAAALIACDGSDVNLDFDGTLYVVDEDGAPIVGATVTSGELSLTTDSHGDVSFGDLTGAMLAVVRADGYLAEPVVFGRDDVQPVVVRMLSEMGGTRWVMHTGGDVMFGRRYNAPSSGDPLIPAGGVEAGARDVVSHLAPAFMAADYRTLNLETVVSELPDEAAYPGKRFILNSGPGTLAGVEALGADAVILANNHARDYMDVGIAETRDVLEAAGLPFLGAGADVDSAAAPLVREVAGVDVGLIAFTTVNGSFVNDNLPQAGDPVPDELDESEAWQYEERTWGFDGGGWQVATEARRIGAAWRVFEDAEPELAPDVVAAAWASLIVVYPELQDWVARRGHGGAAAWDDDAESRIAELAAASDVTVVQLHSGFQFQAAPSSFVRSIARDAIDAGADIVICHHPHVLQGAEWYKGRLIVYSLGNFVFEQDFLATFPTAFLRTVWDGTQLLEARFVPLEIIGYKPRPVAGDVAMRTLLDLWSMSAMAAESARDSNGDVRVFQAELDADTVPASLRVENNSAWIGVGPVVDESKSVTVDAGEVTALPAEGLVEGRLGLEPGEGGGVRVGRSLFGWGCFEDDVADDTSSHGSHWDLAGTRKTVVVDADAGDGVGYLRLTRFSTNESSVLARPVARVPLPQHRIYTDVGDRVAEAADPPPTYSIRMLARLTGGGAPALRLDYYAFDDTNPTEDPSSALVSRREISLELPAGRWREIEILLDPADLSGDEEANMVMFYVRLSPPEDGKSTLDVDALQVIEWRDAAAMPPGFGRFELVRNDGASTARLAVPFRPARRGCGS